MYPLALVSTNGWQTVLRDRFTVYKRTEDWCNGSTVALKRQVRVRIPSLHAKQVQLLAHVELFIAAVRLRRTGGHSLWDSMRFRIIGTW